MKLDIEKIDEDVNIVRCNHNEAEDKIVAKSFHNPVDNFAPNWFPTMRTTEMYLETTAVEPWVAKSIVGRVLNQVLLKDGVLEKVSFRHEALLCTTCVGEGVAYRFSIQDLMVYRLSIQDLLQPDRWKLW